MALIKCPECGKEISDKADKCPACGYPIGVKANPNSIKQNNGHRAKLIILSSIVLGIVLFGLFQFISKPMEVSMPYGLNDNLTEEKIKALMEKEGFVYSPYDIRLGFTGGKVLGLQPDFTAIPLGKDHIFLCHCYYNKEADFFTTLLNKVIDNYGKPLAKDNEHNQFIWGNRNCILHLSTTPSEPPFDFIFLEYYNTNSLPNDIELNSWLINSINEIIIQ